MLPILVVILILVNVVVLMDNKSTTDELKVQQHASIEARNELQSKSLKLERMEDEKDKIQSSLREERLKNEKTRKENQSLKVSLQAKREREAQTVKLASVQKPQVAQVSKPAPTVQVSGNKKTWLAASGIPQSEWASVDFIVSRESGWNPNAINPSSGACGLGQQLPCGKWSGAWNDPVAALRAQHGYVRERYGGYPQAVAFWQSNNWY